MKNAEITEAWETFISRLFTLGGSVLFLIGALLAAIAAYHTYERLTGENSSN